MLSGLVSKAEEIGLYSEFRVGTFGFMVSHLRFVDDTLLVVNLIGFDMASVLRANFSIVVL